MNKCTPNIPVRTEEEANEMINNYLKKNPKSSAAITAEAASRDTRWVRSDGGTGDHIRANCQRDRSRYDVQDGNQPLNKA